MQETIREIAEALGYRYQQSGAGIVTGISIDSRTVRPGDLFVALEGEKTDGHRYVQQALERGASVAVSAPERVSLGTAANYLIVEDGVVFLQRLAHWLRQKAAIPVVAVTGSTGKTSTKDFLAALLENLGPIVVTQGNHNNELGLPLTICQLETDTKALVVEMGMRGLGQIDFLCQIARPNSGIITNIGKTHCELLGSQENIAKAKCELLPYIEENGIIALNKKDVPFLRPWLDTCKGQILWYGVDDADNDFWADDIRQMEDGLQYQLHHRGYQQQIELPVQGVHNVSNSLAAIAIAHSLGVSWEAIGTTLRTVKLTGMRLSVTVNASGVTVINDTYNANPDSMKSAISVLMQRKGNRKIAVLGDMYELGQYEAESHRQVGQEAAKQQVDYVIAVGRLGVLIGEAAKAVGCKVGFAVDNAAAIQLLQQSIQPGDVVLIKGSRGMKMEEIVQELMR